MSALAPIDREGDRNILMLGVAGFFEAAKCGNYSF
jgi:hypothetical protein